MPLRATKYESIHTIGRHISGAPYVVSVNFGETHGGDAKWAASVQIGAAGDSHEHARRDLAEHLRTLADQLTTDHNQAASKA